MNVLTIFLLLNFIVLVVAYTFISIRVSKGLCNFRKQLSSVYDALDFLMNVSYFDSIKDKLFFRDQLMKEEEYEKARLINDMIKSEMEKFMQYKKEEKK